MAVPITAVALDRRIDLAATAERLAWPERRRFAYGSVYDADAGGRLFLFGFGAVVHDQTRAIDDSVRRVLEDGTGARFLPETAETYHISVDPQHNPNAPRVGWDQVVIPERSTELVGAVALLLAQSVALERYERAADALLDEALGLARELASTGTLPQGTRTLIIRAGRLMQDRLELARWFYLHDRPEGTWDDPRVAELYDGLFANLELGARHSAMLHKLAAVEQATGSAIDLWQGRRSNALEWAIVILIVVEIVFALIGVL